MTRANASSAPLTIDASTMWHHVKPLARVSLAMLALNPVPAAAEDDPECTFRLSRNCACVVETLDQTLGLEATDFLVRVWVRGLDKNTARRSEFFRANAHQISEIVQKYSTQKDRIATACGTLDFNDDIY